MTGYPGWRDFTPPKLRESPALKRIAEQLHLAKEAQMKALGEMLTPKRSKYHNERTQVDGRWFDSKKEAARYSELVLLEKAGEIRDIACQVRFPLHVNGMLIAAYVADFTYMRCNVCPNERVVEDVKSPATRTKVYILKRKLMQAIHGIEIQEL